jgi:uroporphyrinogen-III synthase
VKLVSISPVTSDTIRELGLPVAAEATEYTGSGVVDALVRLAGAAQGQASGDPEKRPS